MNLRLGERSRWIARRLEFGGLLKESTTAVRLVYKLIELSSSFTTAQFMDATLRHLMRRAILALAILSASACTTQSVTRKGAPTAGLSAPARVNAVDGIDVCEAQILASTFFRQHISGCGYIGIPQLHGHRWTARAFSGYAGKPFGVVEVDAKTGAVSWKGAASAPKHEASKAEIDRAVRRLIAHRETWVETAYLATAQDPFDQTWRVTANALDSRYTGHGCIPFVRGTGRELLFTPDGGLIGYYTLP
jgi:hypothetical protein